jgi:multisubunit Na+/H+ antiporter MnhB subunit
MTVATSFEIVLAAVVLGLAIWTTTVRETYSATVGFVAYGLLVALIWVRLDAVDVALTEAAIGGGLGGVLLLGAAARLRDAKLVLGDCPGKLTRVSAAILSTLIAVGLASAVLLLPESPLSLAPTVVSHTWATSLSNPVTNVLMAFRAMDTLLEKVVLLLAIVGVWSLAPENAWDGHPGPRHQADPNGVLAFLARLLPPVSIVVAIYILWTGANHPGGAFQGGAILASMWLLAIMAGLTDTPAVSSRRLRFVLTAGPGLFLIVGLGGLWFGVAFLAYPLALAKPLILGIEIAMILTIAATLGLLLSGIPERSSKR